MRCPINRGGMPDDVEAPFELVSRLSVLTQAVTSYFTSGTSDLYADGTTRQTFTTPSSPAVANRSWSPFLGHHTTELISCTSCACVSFAIIL